jgi:hypothetical protein
MAQDGVREASRPNLTSRDALQGVVTGVVSDRPIPSSKSAVVQSEAEGGADYTAANFDYPLGLEHASN